MRTWTFLSLLALVAACSSSDAADPSAANSADVPEGRASPEGGAPSDAAAAGDAEAAVPLPEWAKPIPPNTWTELPNTSFMTWASANIPPDAYNGSNPISALVDAYSDPALDPTTMKAYFYGGGHGNGTCNAIVEFDLRALAYRLAMAPTPVSAYPPSYRANGANQPGPLVYPSGAKPGYFSSTLTDPADVAYKAPFDARPSTHQYAAHAVRQGVISYFYAAYGEFDIAAKKWQALGADPFGPQLFAIKAEYNDLPLQQGTVAIYDEKTDRFFVTLNPGDGGGNWRNHLMRVAPGTRKIEALTELQMNNSISVVRVDRHLYGFTKTGYPLVTMNQGWRFDMDTGAVAYFELTGSSVTFSDSLAQETVPAFFHAGRGTIYRWNYEAATVGGFDEVNLTPTGGTGTMQDRYRLTQTRVAAGGKAPENTLYVYRRLFFDPATRIAMVLPRADSNWFAIRL